MAVVYPSSLGLLEGVTQMCMKAIMAMVSTCSDASWPSECFTAPVLYVFVAVFAIVGVMTVVWLKIVYTRYETTTALPIEYGTVHACSVLCGFVFFREYAYMTAGQVVAAMLGLAIVMCGVAVSSRDTRATAVTPL